MYKVTAQSIFIKIPRPYKWKKKCYFHLPDKNTNKKNNLSLALSSHQKKGGFADSVSPDNVTKGHDVILNTHYQLPNCLITNSHLKYWFPSNSLSTSELMTLPMLAYTIYTPMYWGFNESMDLLNGSKSIWQKFWQQYRV